MTMMPGRDWIRSHKKTVAAAALGVVLLVAAALGVFWFGWDWKALIGWKALVHYIRPEDATDRKDAVQVYAIIVAGVIGLIGAIVGLVGLYFSRKNLQNARDTLQQQRKLEDKRAQDTALQAFFEQIGKLLTDQDLLNTKRRDIRLLAQAQTLTIVRRLDASGKGHLLSFLYGLGLINKQGTVVSLRGADLSGAYLRGVRLKGATLTGATLTGADLREADLREADLVEADLEDATLIEADLSGADLRRAHGITKRQLVAQARSLEGATLPNK